MTVIWGVLGGLVVSPLIVLIAQATTKGPPPPRVTWLMVAVGAALGGVAVAAVPLGGWVPTLAYAAASLVAVAAALVDVTEHRLPNVLTYSLIVVGAIVLSTVSVVGGYGSPGRALVGAVIYGGWLFLAALTGVGAGDVKLAAALGLWLGWISWYALVAGIILGQLLMTVSYFVGRRTVPRADRSAYRSPLGPAITIGFLAALLTVGLTTT